MHCFFGTPFAGLDAAVGSDRQTGIKVLLIRPAVLQVGRQNRNWRGHFHFLYRSFRIAGVAPLRPGFARESRQHIMPARPIYWDLSSIRYAGQRYSRSSPISSSSTWQASLLACRQAAPVQQSTGVFPSPCVRRLSRFDCYRAWCKERQRPNCARG